MADSGARSRAARIDELRYAAKARSALEQLTTLGIAVQLSAVVPYRETRVTWEPYIDWLLHGDASRVRLPGTAQARMQDILDAWQAPAELTLVCFWLVDSTPIGVVVGANSVLARATEKLVSRQHDLMLTTPDVASGLCVELNHESVGDYYDVTAWGVFRAPLEPAAG